jgi:hypothetical protein
MIDVGPHLDFLDFDDLLPLSGLVGLFLRLVLELAIVEDFADGRLGLRRYFNKVEAGIIRTVQGIIQSDNANVLSCFVNQANGGGIDPFVYPRPRLGRRCIGIKSSSDCRNLLFCCSAKRLC